jgi:hypothetical protein
MLAKESCIAHDRFNDRFPEPGIVVRNQSSAQSFRELSV